MPQSLLHLADLGASLRNFQSSLTWGLRITQEFLAQGDRELSLGLPVGPMNSKDQPSLSVSQVGVPKTTITVELRTTPTTITVELGTTPLSSCTQLRLTLPAARLHLAHGYAPLPGHVRHVTVGVRSSYISGAARERPQQHETVVGKLRQRVGRTAQEEEPMSGGCGAPPSCGVSPTSSIPSSMSLL